MSVEKRDLIRFKVLIDTKPLYGIIIAQIGIKRNLEYGEELLKYLRKMKLPLASTWPVFTETLYFIYRDLKERKDFDTKLEEIKRILKHVEELDIKFHEILSKLTKDFDIADATLLELAKKAPIVVLTEDYKLVKKARSMDIIALTPYELLSIAIEGEENILENSSHNQAS